LPAHHLLAARPRTVETVGGIVRPLLLVVGVELRWACDRGVAGGFGVTCGVLGVAQVSEAAGFVVPGAELSEQLDRLSVAVEGLGVLV
jgi:hypothetical protein